MSNKTIDYYNENARKYFEQTVNAKMFDNQERFLRYLENKSTILDFGCGSGRDIKYFLEQGYSVYGIDGSFELCKLAKEYSGCTNIQCINFLEYSEQEKYDGIWACASMLHLTMVELKIILGKLIDACFDHGIIYSSFKYGDFTGERDHRYYIDMNENTMADLVYLFDELSIEDMWISKDVLPGRGEQKWLNVILRVVK